MHSIYFRRVTADLYVAALGDPRRVPRRDAHSTASMERDMLRLCLVSPRELGLRKKEFLFYFSKVFVSDAVVALPAPHSHLF